MAKKVRSVICDSGVKGWRAKLRDIYSDYEDFERHSKIFDLHKRLDYPTAISAWEDNPLVQGSTIPSDYRVVNEDVEAALQLLSLARSQIKAMEKILKAGNEKANARRLKGVILRTAVLTLGDVLHRLDSGETERYPTLHTRSGVRINDRRSLYFLLGEEDKCQE